MIISAYAKANLMDDELYKNLKREINRRLYEFTSPTELCMILNALARCKVSAQQCCEAVCDLVGDYIVLMACQTVCISQSCGANFER